MNKYTVFLGLLFIELILETGVQLESYIVQGVSFKNIVIYGLFLVTYAQRIKSSRYTIDPEIKRIYQLFLIFIIYALFLTIISGSIGWNEYRLMPGLMSLKNELIDSFLCLLIFFYLSYGVKSVNFMMRTLAVIIGMASVVTVLDVAVSSVSIFGFDDIETNRARGAFGEPNQTAAILALYLPFTIGLSLSGVKHKLIYIAVTLSVLAALISTVSRGGILASVVAGICFLWLIRKDMSFGKKTLFIISVPIIFVFGLAVLPQALFDLVLERFTSMSGEKTSLQEASAGRSMLWEMSFNMWLESILIGQGWNAFRNIEQLATHNTYLDYLVSVGLLGTSLIMTVWYKLTRFLLKTRSYCQTKDERIIVSSLVSGLIGLFIALMFVNLYKPWLFVWSFIGVSLIFANTIRLNYKDNLKQDTDNTENEMFDVAVSNGSKFESVKLR